VAGVRAVCAAVRHVRRGEVVAALFAGERHAVGDRLLDQRQLVPDPGQEPEPAPRLLPRARAVPVGPPGRLPRIPAQRQGARADLDLLTPDDVCTLLKVKKSWLYDTVEAGAIEVIRLGKQLRFQPSAISAFLAEHARSQKGA
jgi:excisionase family DNA binding protein